MQREKKNENKTKQIKRNKYQNGTSNAAKIVEQVFKVLRKNSLTRYRILTVKSKGKLSDSDSEILLCKEL